MNDLMTCCVCGNKGGMLSMSRKQIERVGACKEEPHDCIRIAQWATKHQLIAGIGSGFTMMPKRSSQGGPSAL